MSAHAWLEQKNRETMVLKNGETAIVACPDDYEAAYRIFNEVCQRSVVNLSDTHRKILDALYGLAEDFPMDQGFSQRKVANRAEVSPQTVGNNKTFLVTSAKLVRETEHGLTLVSGVSPEEWSSGDLTRGLPSPEKVRAWWDEQHPDPTPPNGPKTAGHPEQSGENGHKADTYAENAVQPDVDTPVDVSTSEYPAQPQNGHVHHTVHSEVDSENGVGKPKTPENGEVSSVSSGFEPSEGVEWEEVFG